MDSRKHGQDSIAVMPPRKTPGEVQETLSDEQLADLVAAKLAAEVTAALELHRKQLDHIDEMVHGLVAFIDQYRPLLERFAKWTGAGRGWRAWQNGAATPKKPGGQ